MADLELNYRVFEGEWGYVDVRLGARYNNLYNKVTLMANNQAIDDTSQQIVDDTSKRISQILKQKLSYFNLEERIINGVNAKIDSDVNKVENADLLLPVAPLTSRTPSTLRRAVDAIVNRRQPALVAALNTAAAADIAAVRATANAKAVAAASTAKTAANQAKIAAANKIAAKAVQVRGVVQQRVAGIQKNLQKEIANTLKSKLNSSATTAQQWIDPYIGFAARYNLSKAFYLTAKADIGGFGIGSELTSQGSAAIGCQVTRYIFAEAGYRYLYTNYDQDGFLYDVTQSGFQITTGITF